VAFGKETLLNGVQTVSMLVGQAEFERPERDVEKMRAHVANRAATPVHPSAQLNGCRSDGR